MADVEIRPSATNPRMAAGSVGFRTFESFITISPEYNVRLKLRSTAVQLEVKQDQLLAESGNSESE
jgi:hypothetical protein